MTVVKEVSKFNTLKAGETFKLNETQNELYMKIQPSVMDGVTTSPNAVCLNTGKLVYIYIDSKVLPIDSKIVY